MLKWRYLKNWSQSRKTKVISGISTAKWSLICLQNLDTRKKRFFCCPVLLKYYNQVVRDVELPFEDGGQDDVMRQLSGAHLKQVDIGVDHGIAEVALDVRHGLSFDLQSIAYP